ncbi:Fanconi anemia group E protein [Holothuria leucospilota]|uniref:Fanconi anemia group E protein n=1 Tax=Holothuria leucospilota TaxID=206669 RepID=A0A9Q1BGH7_HOLLE|nr:Fanconi anemia group E protein [Holothuria leucospilota]
MSSDVSPYPRRRRRLIEPFVYFIISTTLKKYYCIMDTLENHLLGKFPTCWRPFLRVLRSQRSDVKILEHFLPRRLNLQTANDDKDHTDVPDWYGLLQNLNDKEPVLREGSIHFSPRFALLPFHSQRTLLMFLEKHKEELPISTLKDFLQGIKEAELTDDWCKLYHHLLNIHSLSKTFSSHQFSSGFVCDKSEDIFKETCQKIRNDSKKHSFVHHQPQCSWLANVKSSSTESDDAWHKSRSVLSGQKQISQNFKRKSDDENASETLVPFMKKQKLELTAEEIFPEVGAAIVKDETNVVCSQGQVESIKEKEDEILKATVWEETHKLTYGPLQDALHAQKVSWTPQLTELLKTFVTLPLPEFDVGCTVMEINSLSLPSLVALSHQVTSLPLNHISFTTSKHLAKCLFITKLTELNHTAPRNLLVALSQFGKVFSNPLLEGCLIPFLHEQELGPHQADLLLKVSKDGLGDAERVLILCGLLQKEQLKWSEHVTAFLQGILNTKVSLDSEALDEVVGALEEHSSTQSQCPKFAKLILAVINKFQKQLTSKHKAGLQSVIQKNKTFLKNAMNVALKKCMT